MDITPENLREMLVSPGHITGEDFELAVRTAENRNIPLQTQLIESGLITDENLGKTVAEFLETRFVDAHARIIKDEHLSVIPEVVARAQRAIVFDVTEEGVMVATDRVDNYEFMRLLEKKTGKPIVVHYATPQGVAEMLQFYRGDLHSKLASLIELCGKDREETHVVELVNLLLEYATSNRASDIHIEPLEDNVRVRFRIDGLLHEVVRYPKEIHERITFRMKILAHLQTDERAAGQDGRFEYQDTDKTFDIRVSILPVTDGENIVMRLLDSRTHRYALETLGLSEHDHAKVLRAIQKPHGMILAVGPTGSGKTTVLYTILEKLNNEDVNIMTIEDPVEYDIEGVQQTQVNPKKNLSFATGLRSIVRQDPDIIMIGEIRDEETADIAINSALTGHLVISTLHTNDAATTFPRLLEMNVEPFLVASSVNLIIALRLVRKVCTHCRESHLLSDKELALFTPEKEFMTLVEQASGGVPLAKLRLYRGAGCKVCKGTGYSERIGMFEILEVDDTIRLLVTQKASAEVITKAARSLGMTALIEDGIVKALNGVTTLEEVLKAART